MGDLEKPGLTSQAKGISYKEYARLKAEERGSSGSEGSLDDDDEDRRRSKKERLNARQQEAFANSLLQDIVGPEVPVMTEVDKTIMELSSQTNKDGQPVPPFHKLLEQYKTKSAIIRYLHMQGLSVKDISAYSGYRYQHVRNVLTTELKRGPNEKP